MIIFFQFSCRKIMSVPKMMFQIEATIVRIFPMLRRLRTLAATVQPPARTEAHGSSERHSIFFPLQT